MLSKQTNLSKPMHLFSREVSYSKCKKNVIKKFFLEINTGNFNVSKFVESIGFALTSPSVDQRVKGTQLLSATLLKLPKDFLNKDEVSFVFTFFCDRLKDHHNVIPCVIDGISALIAMDNVPSECPVKFLASFFQNTTVQSQTRDDRGKILSILEVLTNRWSDELKSLGGDFIYNVINSIDGERDTRNVEFIFTFMPGFCKKFPLLHLAEEMFESFACYFPIDFNPSRTDGRVITRDELAGKLANCLVASEEFFEWDVALIVEKLESDLTVAKVDSLDLLVSFFYFWIEGYCTITPKKQELLQIFIDFMYNLVI